MKLADAARLRRGTVRAADAASAWVDCSAGLFVACCSTTDFFAGGGTVAGGAFSGAMLWALRGGHAWVPPAVALLAVVCLLWRRRFVMHPG